MTNDGFDKRVNKVIYKTLNGHWLFDMYQMVIAFFIER